MRALILIVAAAVLLTASSSVHAKVCNTTGSVWESDADGSMRLIYVHRGNGDKAELLLREEDGLIVARGVIPEGRYSKEVYAMYDLNTGNIVYAKGKFSAEPAMLTDEFPSRYSVQSRFDIQVYTVDNTFTDEFKTILAEYREKGCHDEIVKRSQGRDFDKVKCVNAITALNKVMSQLKQPDKSNFTELTKNVQYQRYVDNLRKRFDCYIIEQMNHKIVTKLRDPKTQVELAYKKKMPDYLEGNKGIVEVETVERYRY